MEVKEIIMIVTIVVTWILGLISKKSKYVSNNMIPLQNLAIGLIVATIEYFITKDFSTAIALSGIFAGGVYDIGHNIIKLFKAKEEQEKELSNGKGAE